MHIMKTRSNKVKTILGVIQALAVFLLAVAVAAEQNNEEKGVINGRNGATMTVQTQDSGNVTVLLTPDTQVVEPEGLFRKKHLNMTALVPGLQVDVKGNVNAQNQLVADTVSFHGSALQTAEDIQAGLAPTDQQVQQNQKQLQAQ